MCNEKIFISLDAEQRNGNQFDLNLSDIVSQIIFIMRNHDNNKYIRLFNFVQLIIYNLAYIYPDMFSKLVNDKVIQRMQDLKYDLILLCIIY